MASTIMCTRNMFALVVWRTKANPITSFKQSSTHLCCFIYVIENYNYWVHKFIHLLNCLSLFQLENEPGDKRVSVNTIHIIIFFRVEKMNIMKEKYHVQQSREKDK